MRKVICLIGEPGTGKTTLFRKFMEDEVWEAQEPVRLVNTMYSAELDMHIIGKYEEGEVFAGTDKLSMCCQNSVCEFITTNNSNIMFEGDRLTNMKFFDFLLKQPDSEVKIIVIEADKSILHQRYEIRGSNQSDSFLKGRKTKISNIRGNFEYIDYIKVFRNESEHDQKNILNYINTFLFDKTPDI